MALKCPKCKGGLVVWPFSLHGSFPCPTCSTQIKITTSDNSFLVCVFYFLPPVLDFLWFLAVSGQILKNSKVSFVDEELNSFYLESDIDENERLAYLASEKEALNELHKPAAAGDDAAQYALGMAYAEGRLVEKNDIESFSWLLKSAAQGNAEAQEAVGEMYFKGQGTERSYEEAYFWHSLAEKSGRPEGSAAALRRYLPPKKIAAIDKRAEAWSPDKS